MKLRGNKKEVRIVKIYFGVVIIIGIILTIWLLIAMHLFIALVVIVVYWFIFLISPFLGADALKIGTDEQKDKQNKKYAYKKKRDWE